MSNSSVMDPNGKDPISTAEIHYQDIVLMLLAPFFQGDTHFSLPRSLMDKFLEDVKNGLAPHLTEADKDKDVIEIYRRALQLQQAAQARAEIQSPEDRYPLSPESTPARHLGAFLELMKHLFPRFKGGSFFIHMVKARKGLIPEDHLQRLRDAKVGANLESENKLENIQRQALLSLGVIVNPEEFEKSCIIYRWQHRVTNLCYVGKVGATSTGWKRIMQHFHKALKCEDTGSHELQQAIRVSPLQMWSIKVIDQVRTENIVDSDIANRFAIPIESLTKEIRDKYVDLLVDNLERKHILLEKALWPSGYNLAL